MKKLLVLVATVAGVVAFGATQASASSAPIVIPYAKTGHETVDHCMDPAGDGDTLEMQVTSFRATGNIAAKTLFEAVRVIATGDALLGPMFKRRPIAEFARLRPRQHVRPDRLAALTPRATEILGRVEGLSNREIAEWLMLNDETVKTLSHVLGKLGLRHRTLAVVVAYVSGLVVPSA